MLCTANLLSHVGSGYAPATTHCNMCGNYCACSNVIFTHMLHDQLPTYGHTCLWLVLCILLSPYNLISCTNSHTIMSFKSIQSIQVSIQYVFIIGIDQEYLYIDYILHQLNNANIHKLYNAWPCHNKRVRRQAGLYYWKDKINI